MAEDGTDEPHEISHVSIKSFVSEAANHLKLNYWSFNHEQQNSCLLPRLWRSVMVLKQNCFYFSLITETRLTRLWNEIRDGVNRTDYLWASRCLPEVLLCSHLLRLSCAGQRMFLLSLHQQKHTNMTKLMIDSYSSVFLFKIRESLRAVECCGLCCWQTQHNQQKSV